MTWKFVPSDNFTLDQLYHFRDFYTEDLQYSLEYLAYAEGIASKYELPNEKWIVEEAKKDVDESLDNLRKVYIAIAIAKKRNH